MKPWLEALKVGDPVIVCNRSSATATVVRLTKSIIFIRYDSATVLSQEIPFNRSDGHERGAYSGRWSFRPWLEEATPDKLQMIKDRNERYDLVEYFTRRVNWNGIPLPALREIKALVEKSIPPKEEPNVAT